MSSILPNGKIEKVQWCETHKDAWTTNSAGMGSSAATITAWAAKVVAARAKYENQKMLQQAARVATVEFHDAVADLSRSTSDIIKQVKTKASIDGNNDAYNLAQVPPPAIPGPAPVPGTPFKLKVTLVPGEGALKLAWKCTNSGNAHGVTYQISRRTSPTGDFQYIATVGPKTFTDTTLPAGSSQVTYKIVAIRSTARGEAAEFTINFGVGSGGETVATVTPSPSSPKLAA